MRRARFTEEQIIGVSKGARGGGEDRGSGAQARRLGGDALHWKAKYGGRDVSEAKRLKQLEDENAKLEKLLAE
jgi:putative transposase